MKFQHGRREFLKTSGAATLVTGMGLPAMRPGYAAVDDAANDFLEVRNPKSLPPRLKAQRTLLGGPGDGYKANVVRTARGELLVIAFYQVKVEGKTGTKPGGPNKHKLWGKLQEPVVLWRSTDDGRTWSERETLPLLGREPYFSITRDGTLFLTSSLWGGDGRSPYDDTVSFLHRSTDHGESWESTPVLPWDDLPAKPVWLSRNVLELRDGTLLLGVCQEHGRHFLWRSADGGKTWDRSIKCELEGVEKVSEEGLENWLFMAETFFWEASNGDLQAIVRVDQKVLPPIPGTEIPQENIDHANRMVVFRSQDGGRRWKLDRPLGSYYGRMYPNVLRLASGKFLLTFTVRSFRPPLGVHAVLGEELEDGFQFDFASDRIVIDDKTPIGQRSGGGFGPTIQLPDGTLVTALSFRGTDNATRIEVVRWWLPEGV